MLRVSGHRIGASILIAVGLLATSGCSSDHATLILPVLGTVQGTVVLQAVHTDPNGTVFDTLSISDANGVRVYLLSNAGLVDSTTTTGGSYRFKNLRPGTYVMMVRPIPAAAKWCTATPGVGGVVAAPIVIGPSGDLAISPNPFVGSLRTEFGLAADGHVTLQIRGAGGSVVKTLYDGMLPAGIHAVMWDGTDDGGAPIASGLYFVALAADDGDRFAVIDRATIQPQP